MFFMNIHSIRRFSGNRMSVCNIWIDSVGHSDCRKPFALDNMKHLHTLRVSSIIYFINLSVSFINKISCYVSGRGGGVVVKHGVFAENL